MKAISISLPILMFLPIYFLGQGSFMVREDINGKMITLQSGAREIGTVPAVVFQNTGTFVESDGPAGGEAGRENGWIMKFSAANKVFKDISFADSEVGYIVTELGAVYKSTNGGDNWTSVMNLGFPYYWYGVHALSPDTVVIAGFNNQAPITGGVVRWTYNGGASWEPEINLNIPVSAVGWLDHVHFFNADTGIVMNSFSGGCWYTATGGRDAASWSYVTINPDMAWFAGNIDAMPSGKVYAAGMHMAISNDFGINWTSGPHADPVFDGGIDYLDDNILFGCTGGGQISAPVSGWIHRTIDGGAMWGERLMTFPYPIRALHFLDESRGWAVGGNLYDEAGGIYITEDGGLTWNLEVSTAAEMFSMEFREVSPDSTDIWCVGSTGGSTGFTGKLYKKRIGTILAEIGSIPGANAGRVTLNQNYPNPFSHSTTITCNIRETVHMTIKLLDVCGKEILTLTEGIQQPGLKTFNLDGSRLPEGIYFYRLQTDYISETRKLILSR
jgi:hypothetical protein